MPGGKNNITPKDGEKTQFKKGQSGNPKGRPPKLVSHVLDKLKEDGHEKVSKSQVREVYEFLIGLQPAKLRAIAKDKETPILFKLVAEGILSKKGFDILERLLDRAQGKPTQSQQVTATIEAVAVLEVNQTKDPLPTDDQLED